MNSTSIVRKTILDFLTEKYGKNIITNPGTIFVNQHLKLSTKGFQSLSRFYKHYRLQRNPGQWKVKHHKLLGETMKFPYYVTDKSICVFDETVAFEIKLYDGDVFSWLEAKESS
jgi:hypothetical protein